MLALPPVTVRSRGAWRAAGVRLNRRHVRARARAGAAVDGAEPTPTLTPARLKTPVRCLASPCTASPLAPPSDRRFSEHYSHHLRPLLQLLRPGLTDARPFASAPACCALPQGATVAAVARSGPKLQSLIDFAKASPGTLLLPQLKGSAAPGADLLTHVPEIRTWLQSPGMVSAGSGRKVTNHHVLVVGAYVYLDGEAHVRATVAADMLQAELVRSAKEKGSASAVALAQLCSPGACIRRRRPASPSAQRPTRTTDRYQNARSAAATRGACFSARLLLPRPRHLPLEQLLVLTFSL